MSQDDPAARDDDAESPASDDERTTVPPSDDEPQAPLSRQSRLVLADSTPPPPPDIESSEDDFELDIPVEISQPFELTQLTQLAQETPPSAEARDQYLNKVIAERYEIVSYLGRGSMGTVYRCRHRVLDKDFAVKIIRQELVREAEAVGRFVTEAKAASAIGSKHIVEVIDFGELPDGAVYIMMEYLEGQTLYRELEQTPRLPLSRALNIAIQIADALADAHDAAIVHRDLKPDNVFLTRFKGKDFVKILDFGIAKVQRSGNKLTQAGTVIGTPAYMSPEQAMGRETDHRTDIYALGIMLYEMVCGHVPFDAESPLAVLQMQVTDTAKRVSDALPENEHLPGGYDEVVIKCLAKHPVDRFQSMDELKTVLETIAAGVVPEISLPPESGRPSITTLRNAAAEVGTATLLTEDDVSSLPRRLPKKAFVAGVIGLGALAVLAFLAVNRPREVAAPAPAVSVLAAPAPAPPPSAPAAAPSDLKEVHIILFPLDARVYDLDRELGMMPLSVKVAPGEVKHLTVSRRGYISRKLTIDGNRTRVVVGLIHEGTKGAAQAERAADLAAERAAAQAQGKKAPPESAAPPAEPPPTEGAQAPAEPPASDLPKTPAEGQ